MIIIVIIIGFIFGNFTTSFYYRITNNKPVNGYGALSGEPPHCSLCKHPLKFYEYLPILSMFATRFKFVCNYCGGAINPIYTLLECSTAALFAINYFFIKSEQVLVLTFLYIPVGLLSAVLACSGYKTPKYLLWFSAFLGVLYRTTLDGNFYLWFCHLLVLSMFIISKYKDKSVNIDNIIYNYSVLAIGCCWLKSIPLIIMLVMRLFAYTLNLKRHILFSIDWMLLYLMILLSELYV